MRPYNELVPCYKTIGEESESPIDESYLIISADKKREDNKNPPTSQPFKNIPETKPTESSESKAAETLPERRYPKRERKPTSMLRMSFGNRKRYAEMSAGSQDDHSADSPDDKEDDKEDGQTPQ